MEPGQGIRGILVLVVRLPLEDLLQILSHVSTWQKLRILDIGKTFETLGYGVEIDPLVILHGLDACRSPIRPSYYEGPASSPSGEAVHDLCGRPEKRTLCTSRISSGRHLLHRPREGKCRGNERQDGFRPVI